ncbi:DUF423 domain-containing protein [Atopomonas hussainii]|uniref:DUF423 domain-containing protein n=1 Tax=Atopomonas hussainii TaxID=1429083 RepID=UPI00090026D8|nr:DUF423 domain-containing protein [Atopomonas hussainii]
MQRWALLVAAVAGFLAVALGAFAAHGLRNVLSAEYLTVFQTGVHYQMVHALALLAVGMLLQKSPARSLRIAAWSFTLGIVLFSGSLYALTLSGVRGLGMITPFGGVAFLVGWASLAWFAWRSR